MLRNSLLKLHLQVSCLSWFVFPRSARRCQQFDTSPTTSALVSNLSVTLQFKALSVLLPLLRFVDITSMSLSPKESLCHLPVDGRTSSAIMITHCIMLRSLNNANNSNLNLELLNSFNCLQTIVRCLYQVVDLN